MFKSYQIYQSSVAQTNQNPQKEKEGMKKPSDSKPNTTPTTQANKKTREEKIEKEKDLINLLHCSCISSRRFIASASSNDGDST